MTTTLIKISENRYALGSMFVYQVVSMGEGEGGKKGKEKSWFMLKVQLVCWNYSRAAVRIPTGAALSWNIN